MQEVVDVFFDQLKNLFQKSGLANTPELANQMWNFNTTGFCTAVSLKAVLKRRRTKEVHETAGGSGREYITVLGTYVIWNA